MVAMNKLELCYFTTPKVNTYNSSLVVSFLNAVNHTTMGYSKVAKDHTMFVMEQS